MPNVLDIEPLRAVAQRASLKIGDAKLAERFVTISLDWMLQDARCLRPATAAEIACAPDWTERALARGESLSAYERNAGVSAHLNRVAQRLADTRAVAAAAPRERLHAATHALAARHFLSKLDRMNFETAADQALRFSRVLRRWRDDDAERTVCEPQTLCLLGGRVWRRVTSVAELRRTGAEFGNCLARTTSVSAYGARLARGQAQFWVLRDHRGKGLIVAMAAAPQATHFLEVKGPRNAPVLDQNPDLVKLGLAIGVPEPLFPAQPLMPAVMTPGMLEMRGPCRCPLCEPVFARPFRLRQRNTAS